LMGSAHFAQKDATKLGERPATTEPVTIAFLDPPYRKGLVQPTLEALQNGNWLGDGAMIVIETEHEAEPVQGCGEVTFDKTYGETRVRFYLYRHPSL